MKFASLSAAALLAVALATPAAAAIVNPIGRQDVTGLDVGGIEFDASRGYRFRATQDYLTVRQLGISAPADGTYTLSLFDAATQALLAQTTIDVVGTGWQFVDLATPLGLAKDHVYVVSEHADELLYYFAVIPPANLLPAGAISYEGMNYCNFCGGASAFPTQTLDGSLYGVPDIGYSVPEPASMALLGAGLLALVTGRGRRTHAAG